MQKINRPEISTWKLPPNQNFQEFVHTKKDCHTICRRAPSETYTHAQEYPLLSSGLITFRMNEIGTIAVWTAICNVSGGPQETEGLLLEARNFINLRSP